MSEIYPTEYEEQCVFFDLLRLKHPEIYAVSWSHVDGAWHGRDKKVAQTVASKQKKAGAKVGVPDIVINVARGKFHGLYIEMKRQVRGVVSDEQKEMLRLLSDQGYACFVAKGADAAMLAVERYLKL